MTGTSIGYPKNNFWGPLNKNEQLSPHERTTRGSRSYPFEFLVLSRLPNEGRKRPRCQTRVQQTHSMHKNPLPNNQYPNHIHDLLDLKHCTHLYYYYSNCIHPVLTLLSYAHYTNQARPFSNFKATRVIYIK